MRKKKKKKRLELVNIFMLLLLLFEFSVIRGLKLRSCLSIVVINPNYCFQITNKIIFRLYFTLHYSSYFSLVKNIYIKNKFQIRNDQKEKRKGRVYKYTYRRKLIQIQSDLKSRSLFFSVVFYFFVAVMIFYSILLYSLYIGQTVSLDLRQDIDNDVFLFI